jgi:N-dimethylarginine dimethylaminohydrolase
MTAPVLMCRPDHFGIEYEINPWMNIAVKVDHALAGAQWDMLHRTYLDLGIEIELAAPVAGLPDMVFTANAAVLWDDRAVLSNFHHDERRGEETHWRRELERLGLDVHELPRSLSFEGAGDALFLGDRLRSTSSPWSWSTRASTTWIRASARSMPRRSSPRPTRSRRPHCR